MPWGGRQHCWGSSFPLSAMLSLLLMLLLLLFLECSEATVQDLSYLLVKLERGYLTAREEELEGQQEEEPWRERRTWWRSLLLPRRRERRPFKKPVVREKLERAYRKYIINHIEGNDNVLGDNLILGSPPPRYDSYDDDGFYNYEEDYGYENYQNYEDYLGRTAAAFRMLTPKRRRPPPRRRLRLRRPEAGFGHRRLLYRRQQPNDNLNALLQAMTRV